MILQTWHMAPPPYLSALENTGDENQETWKYIRLTQSTDSRIQLAPYPCAYPLWCACHSSRGYTADLCVATLWNTLCRGKVGGARPLIEVLKLVSISGLFLCSLTKVLCAVFPESNPSLEQILGDVSVWPLA